MLGIVDVDVVKAGFVLAPGVIETVDSVVGVGAVNLVGLVAGLLVGAGSAGLKPL